MTVFALSLSRGLGACKIGLPLITIYSSYIYFTLYNMDIYRYEIIITHKIFTNRHGRKPYRNTNAVVTGYSDMLR